MNFSNIIAGICAALFFMIGADKFLNFMEPPCSVMDTVSPTLWKVLGVIQLAGGILIMMPKFRKGVAGFFVAFMLFFIVYHLSNNTYDIGGAVFMAVLLALIVWNPSFLGAKESEE